MEFTEGGTRVVVRNAGNAKPVSVIEDTAVAPERLPAYMKDFGEMLERLGLKCVYHAHISTGELHLRPVLNLKEENDRVLFRACGGRDG
ncbi:MAG: FAD-linked oxidase C-terminal domain-containing protein [Butyricimonas faecihominis]